MPSGTTPMSSLRSIAFSEPRKLVDQAQRAPLDGSSPDIARRAVSIVSGLFCALAVEGSEDLPREGADSSSANRSTGRNPSALASLPGLALLNKRAVSPGAPAGGEPI